MTSTADEPLERLGRACLAHFAAEAAVLREACAAAQTLDAALVAGRISEWNAAAADAQQIAAKMERLGAGRTELRRRICASLHAGPESATLAALAQRLTEPLRVDLLRVRNELKASWESLHRLQGRQTAFVRVCGEFLRRLFEDLGASAPVGPRYGPHGRPVSADLGPRFAARG